MPSTFLWVKFLHVALAVVVGGTSASLGLWLEFFARPPAARAVVLHGIRRLLEAVVMPGLVVQALLGLWLVDLGPWTWDVPWLQAAAGLWFVLMASVVGSDVALRRMAGPAGVASAWPYRAAQSLGGLAGVSFLAILFLMVTRGA